MAQSVLQFPTEQVLVDCRAIVFSHDINRWIEVGEPNVCSQIQLICNLPPGSTRQYRVLARLESTGMVTINILLSELVTYHVSDPSWHQISIDLQGLYYGLRISPDSDGNKFAVIIQHTLRSLQGTLNQPTWPQPPDPLVTGALPTVAPAAMLRTPEPPLQLDKGRAQARRALESQIDVLCSTLSDAIKNGRQDQALEIVTKMVFQKLHLSIKLKNPTLVTMDSGGNTVNIRVVVEDKESSGGTFSMKVSPTSTIERLQQEVFDRYGFPVQVQKWIVGKKIPKPGDTLQDLNVRQSGATVFLYLLSGKTVGLRRSDVERFGRGNALPTSASSSAASLSSNNVVPTTIATTTATFNASGVQMRHTVSVPNLSAQNEAHLLAAPNGTERLPHLNPSPPQSLPNQGENSGQTVLPFRLGMSIDDMRNLIAQQSGGQGDGSNNPPNQPPQEAFVNNLLEPVPQQQVEEDGSCQGWTCPRCTFINVPTRPGCEICSAERPADYEVPTGAALDERERTRIAAEEREEALFQQAEQTRQREEQLAREQNLAALLQTAQQTLIPNQEEFDCGICFVPVEPGQGVMLRECLHRFCRDCLIEHIRHATDPEVQCPHQDDNYACHATITGQEIRALLSEEDFNKFLNRSLATAESQAANSFHCKTPNCQGWCLYEDNVNTFYCPVCNQPNCLTCKAIHADKNCKEYQDDLKRRAQNDEAARKTQQFLENMVASGDAMHCPVCEIILLKKDGCDWMRCSMCRTEICWATRGPRWGPGGTGDISGGCKCRVGGKKCHPRCRNCH